MEWLRSMSYSFNSIILELNAWYGIQYDRVLGLQQDFYYNNYWVIDEISYERLACFKYADLYKSVDPILVNIGIQLHNRLTLKFS